MTPGCPAHDRVESWAGDGRVMGHTRRGHGHQRVEAWAILLCALGDPRALEGNAPHARWEGDGWLVGRACPSVVQAAVGSWAQASTPWAPLRGVTSEVTRRAGLASRHDTVVLLRREVALAATDFVASHGGMALARHQSWERLRVEYSSCSPRHVRAPHAVRVSWSRKARQTRRLVPTRTPHSSPLQTPRREATPMQRPIWLRTVGRASVPTSRDTSNRAAATPLTPCARARWQMRARFPSARAPGTPSSSATSHGNRSGYAIPAPRLVTSPRRT
jgi:hypothetical protein